MIWQMNSIADRNRIEPLLLPLPGRYGPFETVRCTDRAISPHALSETVPSCGGANRCVEAALDTQARQQYDAVLQQAIATAEAATRSKDRFLAILGHELRTPLAPAFTALHELLDDPAMSRGNAVLLEIIAESLGIEIQLIDNLMDMARLSHGKIVPRLEPIDVHDIVPKAIAVCRADIERKRLDVTIDLSASNSSIESDPVRLEQVIWNLLRNAAKFTPDGGSIRVSTRNDEQGHLLIEVADTGIGIDENMLMVIFNAFEQGERSITQNFGGLGLGLAISRMLLEMLGGRIYAASAGRGRGATFTVELSNAPQENMPRENASREVLP